MARCFCACHQHPGTYPPPCAVCGHHNDQGRFPSTLRDGWEPNDSADEIVRLQRYAAVAEERMRIAEAKLDDADAEMVAAESKLQIAEDALEHIARNERQGPTPAVIAGDALIQMSVAESSATHRPRGGIQDG